MKSVYFKLSLILFMCSCLHEAKCDAPDWVKKEKIRSYWGAPYELIEPLKEAGFNVMIPRWEIEVFPEDLENITAKNVEDYTFKQANEEFKRQSALCKKIGMRYFPCLNTGAIGEVVLAGLKDNPRRHSDVNMPCPLDELYWDRVIIKRFEKIMNMLSGPEYQLDGFIIDPEMYYFKGAFLKLPCYCKWCREEFVKTNPDYSGIKDVKDSSAENWLKDKNLKEAYDKWQFTKSRAMVKKLATMVHSRKPDMLLGFAIWEPYPWFSALAEGLSNNDMPVIIITELPTYSGAFDDAYLNYEKTLLKEVPVKFLNCPGIWVNANAAGEAPERLLKVVPGNLYHRTILADGYFLYASDRWGGTREKAEPFTKVFKTINMEIDKYIKSNGTYQSGLLPQRLPLDPPGNLKKMLRYAQSWDLHEAANSFSASNELPHLREAEGLTQMVFFKAVPGDKVKITMQVIQLKDTYIDKGAMSIFAPDGNNIADLFCECNGSVSYDLEVKEAGAYAVVSTANSNAYTIDIKGAPWVITANPVKLNKVGGKMFFYVPAEQKVLKTRFGGTGEAADYVIYDNTGKEVLNEKTVRLLKNVDINSDGKSGLWCIEVSNLEDDTEFGIDGITGYAVYPGKFLADTK